MIKSAIRQLGNRYFLPVLIAITFIHLITVAQPAQSEQTSFGASNNLYQWGTISSFHGLPSERVNAIAQTNDGVLWFGTDRGLAKFDGRRVQTITSQNLSTLQINALKITKEGRLWIGTKRGAFYFENELFTPVNDTLNHSVNSIHMSNSDVFLTTENGMVFKIKPGSGNSIETETLLNQDLEITSIAQVDNKVLVGTTKRGTLVVKDSAASELLARPKLQNINAFETGKDGKLWIGVQTAAENSGLYFAKTPTDWEKIDAAVGSVVSISFDSFKNIWVGTKDRGAFQFRGTKQVRRYTFENTAGGLRSNEILTTFVDREDVIWFGTNKGICRYDPNSPQSENISGVAESNYVRTLFQTSRGVVVAGTNRGLYYRDKSEKWQEVRGFEERPVYSISEDSSGQLQIGNSDGFYSDVDLNAGANRNFGSFDSNQHSSGASVRAIQRFQNKTYLAVFGVGLGEFRNEQVLFNHQSTELEQIISLYSENEKTLWLGTAKNGVFSFDGTQIRQFPALEPLKNVAVWSIAGDGTKGIWFATEAGLYLFRRNELQKVLSDTDVRSVKLWSGSGAQQESIWCATINGLIQIIPNEDFGWIISRIDVEQGLPSQSSFTILRQKGDDDLESILIGTNRGVVKYKLNRVHPLMIPLRILSKRLHAFNELPGGINLEYPQTSLSVEVAGISSRTFPEQFQYSFLLKNSKNEIINSKLSNESQFLMENLAADNYRVEIRAYDKYLSPSEPIIFGFSIANPPFPLTTLALTVLLTLAVIALIWATKSQRRISRASADLAYANRELNSARLDLANEAERERRRISRDLHDQTLADLRHLFLLTEKLPKDEESAEKAGVFRTEIEAISNEIRNICEDLSPSVLENIGFAAALEWALTNAVQDSPNVASFEFFCMENIEERLTFSPTAQIQIYRIAQEVLSNIVQHSNATCIKMSLDKNSFDTFIMKIEDNGEGFDVSRIQSLKGRGLANIRARANLIDAELFWSEGPGGETIFQLAKS